MEIDFWLDRWNRDETGFHQQSINPYLEYFYGDKGPAPERREKLKVFVPLCGKSLDLLWLSQNNYNVLGVECSERAVKAFFEENAIEYRVGQKDSHSLYMSNQLPSVIEIFHGDFFTLQQQDFEDITDVYDRASLIALPEDMRTAYVNKMTALQKTGTRTLLVTLSYDQAEMDGPPFSVSEQNVHELYSDKFAITKLCYKDIINDEPRFKNRGLGSLVETVYKLVRN